MYGAPVWLKAGAQVFSEGGLRYLDSSDLVHTLFMPITPACRGILTGAVEAYRVNGAALCGDMELLHPSEASDPLCLADSLAGLKVKENLNSRLARSSTSCCYVRAVVTRESSV